MPECHKIYPNCICHVPTEWYGLNFNWALLTKGYWNFATHIIRVSVSSKSPINPNLPFTKKSNLQVKFGFVGMDSLYDLLCYQSLTSTDPLLENYSFIFLHVSTHLSSIVLSMNTPRMKNQTIPSTPPFLHFISTIRPLFPKFFYIFPNLYAAPGFLPQQRAQDIQKVRRPRTTDDPKEGPKTLQHPETAGIGEHLQLPPPFRGSPGGEQSEPLPTVETCDLVVARQISSELLNQSSSDSLINFTSHCAPSVYHTNFVKLGNTSGSSMRLVRSPLVALANTAHC